MPLLLLCRLLQILLSISPTLDGRIIKFDALNYIPSLAEDIFLYQPFIAYALCGKNCPSLFSEVAIGFSIVRGLLSVRGVDAIECFKLALCES